MQNTIREAKRALRTQIGALLKEIALGEQVTASARARALLKQQAVWQTAQWILFFAPLPGELDIWPLLAEALSAGKKVALPRFAPETRAYETRQVLDLGADVQVGHFGIREPHRGCAPLPSPRLDLILVPGVAFDVHGRRLGRGKGYYDQLLKGLRGTTCGVAFDQQFVAEVPAGPHDVCLDCLLTPTRWIEVPSSDPRPIGRQ
jgi:5-formyltetrahydrofolate cyclo-ligase